MYRTNGNFVCTRRSGRKQVCVIEAEARRREIDRTNERTNERIPDDDYVTTQVEEVLSDAG